MARSIPGKCALITVATLGGLNASSAFSAEEMVRALFKPVERVELRTDLIAKISQSPFRQGMGFDEGDVLVAFDCERYQADLSSARASAEGAAIELRRQQRLHRHGAAAKSDVAKAKSEVARTDAETRIRSSRMRDCVIVAPFAGRVVEVHARTHEMSSAGEPLMTLINDEQLEIEMLVPSHWLKWLRPDAAFSVDVDETGKSHAAVLTRIGAEVDPVSQTVKVFGAMDAKGQGVLAGMSGVARFAVPGSDT